jgi:hypothetical protein
LNPSPKPGQYFRRSFLACILWSRNTGSDVAFEKPSPDRGLEVLLYISGYTSNALVHYGVLDPGLWFLPRPFSLTTLIAKVREVLDASSEAP